MHTGYMNIIIYVYLFYNHSLYHFTIDITILIRIRQVATLFLTARQHQG